MQNVRTGLWRLILPLWLSVSVSFGQVNAYLQTQHRIDSLRRVAVGNPSIALANNYLDLACEYLGIDQSDSVQYYLDQSQPLIEQLRYHKGNYFRLAYQTELFDQNALYNEALRYADSTLRTATSICDPELIGDAHMLMGLVYTDMHQPHQAIDHLQQSLLLLPTRSKELHGLAHRFHALNNLSQSYNALHRYTQAIQYGTEARYEALREGSLRGQTVACWSIGNAWLALNAPDSAQRAYEQGLQIAVINQDFDGQLLLYPRLYDLLVRQKKSFDARQRLHESQQLLMKQTKRLSVLSQIDYYTYLLGIYQRSQNWQAIAETQQALLNLNQQRDQQKTNQQLKLLRSHYVQQVRLTRLAQQHETNRQQLQQSRQLSTSLSIVVLLLALLVGTIYYVLRQRQTMQFMQLRNQLTRETLQVELQILKAQIHPHFLFNTLNNLYSLTLKHSPKAPSMVLKLSGLLHYILHECNAPTVPLPKEIEFLENYIELEKLRYGKRLNVTMTVQGVARQTIAPLLLIPFVENAFKHGSSQQAGQTYIKLALDVVDDALCFIVENSVDKSPTNRHRSGIGLDNVRKRLQLIYPDCHSLLINADDTRFTVKLTITLTNNQPNHSKVNKPPLIPDHLVVDN